MRNIDKRRLNIPDRTDLVKWCIDYVHGLIRTLVLMYGVPASNTNSSTNASSNLLHGRVLRDVVASDILYHVETCNNKVKVYVDLTTLRVDPRKVRPHVDSTGTTLTLFADVYYFGVPITIPILTVNLPVKVRSDRIETRQKQNVLVIELERVK